LATRETKEIANLRGHDLTNHVEHLDDFRLYDSGHILGSRGVIFDDIFYTGDISTRNRGFLCGASIPKCKVLITECTFGRPEFVFPQVDELVKRVNEIIAEMYHKGKPVLLLGYQLGKAQTISYLFGHWEPLYYHDSVKEMNDIHRRLGIPLKKGLGHTEAESSGLHKTNEIKVRCCNNWLFRMGKIAIHVVRPKKRLFNPAKRSLRLQRAC
jgi:putative mRNA 3-end processing factor